MKIEGPKLAVSAAQRVMSYLPEVIEAAVEKGHKALKSLDVSAAAFGKNMGEQVTASVESLLAMLDDIQACLEARKAGAKTLKNEHIDAVLLKNHVKVPRVSRNRDTGKPVVGSKSGASRYIATVIFNTPALWPDKKADALRYIAGHGLQFTQGGARFKSPYDAMRSGVPFSSVHDVWAATVRDLNEQVAPTAKPTTFERMSRQAIKSLTVAERSALIASLQATIPAVVPANPPVQQS